ncbi:hypothetical protein Dimus_039460 [Dionaea muscipula]
MESKISQINFKLISNPHDLVMESKSSQKSKHGSHTGPPCLQHGSHTGPPCRAIYEHGSHTGPPCSRVGATPLQPKDRDSHPGGNSFHNLAQIIISGYTIISKIHI